LPFFKLFLNRVKLWNSKLAASKDIWDLSFLPEFSFKNLLFEDEITSKDVYDIIMVINEISHGIYSSPVLVKVIVVFRVASHIVVEVSSDPIHREICEGEDLGWLIVHHLVAFPDYGSFGVNDITSHVNQITLCVYFPA